MFPPWKTVILKPVAGRSIPQLISAPTHGRLRQRLELKKREYATRFTHKRKPWRNMDDTAAYARYPSYRRTRHKYDMMSAVLELKPYQILSVRAFCKDAIARYGNAFDPFAFAEAQLTILYYLRMVDDGVKEGWIIYKGSGLPILPRVKKETSAQKK